MGMIKLTCEGSWWVNSKTDKRWNGSGRGFVGGFAMPEAAKEFVEKKKTDLGEEPPADLEYGYMKD